MTREELREWLDRRPPVRYGAIGLVGEALLRHRAWRDWFDGDEYLGERSARTGPDAVDAKQRCGCEVCASQLDVKRALVEAPLEPKEET